MTELERFAESERRTQYEPMRSYDWNKRFIARALGFQIPELCGDITVRPDDFGDQYKKGGFFTVVDEFGNVKGWK